VSSADRDVGTSLRIDGPERRLAFRAYIDSELLIDALRRARIMRPAKVASQRAGNDYAIANRFA
jgi:hypothetical protein